MNSSSREDALFMAKLYEQSEHYTDMVKSMAIIAKMKVDMTPQERVLFSVANKNVIGSKRFPIRILESISLKEEEKGQATHLRLARKLQQEVEDEARKFLDDQIAMINICILPYQTTVEGRVFFLKLKGDYNRYKAEFMAGYERKKSAEAALNAYQGAMECAKELSKVNPVYLSLGLNYSLFMYEILVAPRKAIELASKLFEEGMENIDQLEEEAYQDSTLILQLLRDNLTLWNSSEMPPEEEKEEEKNKKEGKGR